MRIGIILNGPPGSGKDTIANLALRSGLATHKRQFKDVLYEHTAKHFNVDLDKFIHFASDRVLKDSKSFAGLGERTPRQALIHASEDVYKPRYGSDYFGLVEAANLRSLYGRVAGNTTVVYPDGGFPDEVLATQPCFDFLLVCRLHRVGYDFSNDSRDYIDLPDTDKRATLDFTLLENFPLHTLMQIESMLNLLTEDLSDVNS